MPGNIVLEIHRRQAVAAREALETWSQSKPSEMRSERLDGLVRLFLDVPARLQQAEREAFDPRRGSQRASYDTLEDLRQVFEEEIRLLEAVQQMVQGARSSDQSVEMAAELDRAVASAVAQRDRIFAHWEPFTAEDECRVREAMLQGDEGVDLDDAMAQAAGLDKESWLRKVEETQRRRARA